MEKLTDIPIVLWRDPGAIILHLNQVQPVILEPDL